MLLKVVDEGEFKDVTIDEGEMFLLPRALTLPPPPLLYITGIWRIDSFEKRKFLITPSGLQIQ